MSRVKDRLFESGWDRVWNVVREKVGLAVCPKQFKHKYSKPYSPGYVNPLNSLRVPHT
ncbi:unnamed protein product, partial [Dovyalis caffra]